MDLEMHIREAEQHLVRLEDMRTDMYLLNAYDGLGLPAPEYTSDTDLSSIDEEDVDHVFNEAFDQLDVDDRRVSFDDEITVINGGGYANQYVFRTYDDDDYEDSDSDTIVEEWDNYNNL